MAPKYCDAYILALHAEHLSAQAVAGSLEAWHCMMHALQWAGCECAGSFAPVMMCFLNAVFTSPDPILSPSQTTKHVSWLVHVVSATPMVSMLVRACRIEAAFASCKIKAVVPAV